MYQTVLIRHGESEWNRENRFTGWTDVDLTDRGREEARQAGKLLKAEGFTFDVAYVSLQKRAIRTLWLILEEMDLMWIPVINDWRLNERHYGSLQGLNKAETAREYGEDQVLIWRRSFDVPPPALTRENPRWPGHDPRYGHLNPDDLPVAESLKLTCDRVIPYWESVIGPDIRSGRKVLVAAHGNSLRALVRHLDGMSDEAILGVNIPTGIPLVYDLDAGLKPLSHRYLGDADAIARAADAVARQGKA